MNHRLAVIKTVSWRVSGILLLGALLFISTGKVDVSVIGTTTYSAIRTVQYYFHEWLWQSRLKKLEGVRILDWIYRRK